MLEILNLPESVVATLLWLLSCLLFTVLLMVVYYNKHLQQKFRNKLYRYILVNIVILNLSQLINTLFIVYGVTGWIYRVEYIIHWWSFITWFCLFYMYCIGYLADIQVNTCKEYINSNVRMKAMIVASILAMIIFVVLPYQSDTAANIRYGSGINEWFVMGFMVVSGFCSVVAAFTTYKNSENTRKWAIVTVLAAMAVAMFCQTLWSDVTIYIISTSIQTYFLYFLLENPDIHLVKEIDDLRGDIERSNKAKTDFLSNMSHEIRTPMNAIVGFSDSLLSSTEFDPQQARADIENISTAGTNLVDIINNILDISKIESEKDTLNNENYSIDKIIKELSSIIKARLGKKPVEFITELDEHIPSKLYGDSTKMYQILLNITNNSVKYTEVGKIKLTCIPENTGNDQVMLHFKITDTGYGIKKEDFDKVFQKFSRLDDAVNNEIEGTGLGLVITKKFVELMGGKIWFTSEFEVGTTFFIDVPFKVIDDTPIGLQKEVITEKSDDGFIRHLDCSNYTVLIVDDSKTNLKVASRLLEKYRFKIDTAENGKDCVYKFKYGNHYDLILLDDMMPEMDGIDTVQVIKKLDVFDIPPIVAFTANAMTGMGEKYLSAGFDYYLPMPVSVQELDELIQTYFSGKVDKYIEDESPIEAPKEEKPKAEETKEAKVEEKPEKKEEVKEEPKEEKSEEKEDAKEEPKEEKPEEKEDAKEEPKEEKPEEQEEAKEEPKEEKPEEKEEVKEEPKIEEKPEEKEDAKEESKEEKSEEKEEVKEESKEEKPEEKEEVKEEPKVEEKSEEALTGEDLFAEQEKYLRDKGVDMDKALEFLGDMEMYNMTLKDFITDVYAKWGRINQYKMSEDMPNYAIEVHSLKSDCKYLGYMKLADVSYEHELKSKDNDLAFVNDNFERLEDQFNETIKLVKEYDSKYGISKSE